ncbi:MAG: hypothetical protein RSI33_04310 [Clostridia bacterium]
MKYWKLLLSVLLLTLMLVSSLPAAAEPLQEPIEHAKSLLTEVFGYTQQEADNLFTFKAEESETEWSIAFYPKAHPQWVYHGSFNKQNGQYLNGSTPFATKYTRYPGEAAVRTVLNQAKEGKWFLEWNKASKTAFQNALTEQRIYMSYDLAKAFALETVTAGQAIHGFFESCYDQAAAWTTATGQWCDEVLAENQAVFETSMQLPKRGMVTYSIVSPFSQNTVEVIEFQQEAPKELAQAFTQPKWSGWSCVSGSMGSYHQGSEPKGQGLAVLGRGEERQLVSLYLESENQTWQAIPLGEKALLTGRELFVTPRNVQGIMKFAIVYPISSTEWEEFVVSSDADGLCRLWTYQHCNAALGTAIVIDGEGRTANGNRSWYHVKTYAPDQPETEELIERGFSEYMAFTDADAFPKTAEECRKVSGATLPQGYANTAGCHLRAKTSSRSADMGNVCSGAIVKVLEVVPGDPNPWAHVQIGALEGYMCGVYVNYEGTGCNMDPFMYPPLKVAVNNQPIQLKKGTGWFAGTEKELPAGTKMHVLMDCENWLYVVVPRGEIGWLMDVEGTYGYVKTADVVQAATVMGLE